MNQKATAKKQSASGVVKEFLLATARNERPSQFIHQITDTNAKSLGNSHERKNAGRFLAAFQFAHINRVQVGLLRQFFLTQLGALSETANRFADNFLMSQGFCHAFSGKQEASETNTVHSPLFLSCTFSGKA